MASNKKVCEGWSERIIISHAPSLNVQSIVDTFTPKRSNRYLDASITSEHNLNLQGDI